MPNLTKWIFAFLIMGGVACSDITPMRVLQSNTKTPSHEKVVLKPKVSALSPEVDILFVIDNSGSMQVFQQDLANNVDVFVNALTSNVDLDWRIAVTTSNNEKMWPGSHGKFYGSPRVVSKTTPNMLRVLNSNLMPGAFADLGLETFFDPVRFALAPNMLSGHNVGFLRADAKLVVIFITDSDDQSVGKVQEPIDFLRNLKKNRPDKIAVYAALANMKRGCESDDEPLPTRILEFLTKMNGVWFSLCDLALGDQVQELGEDISQNFEAKIQLNSRPEVESIQVFYGNLQVPSHPEKGWWYNINDNTIRIGPQFDFKSQPAGSEFRVEYWTDI